MMTRSSVGRMLWPLFFIVPIWAVLSRLCWSRPMHIMLHASMALHERLPAILIVGALASVGVVALKLVRANGSLRTLQALGGTMPTKLQETLTAQATLLGMPEPKVTYLEVETPVCYTVVPGPAILISRGFIEELDEAELALVVLHELVHVRRRDPERGLLWHLVFSALLVPGFGGVERWLYDRREQRTSELSGTLGHIRFEALERRVRRAQRSLERSLGNAYAGALQPQATKRFIFVQPAIAFLIFSALVSSHVVFMNALPGLERHHC